MSTEGRKEFALPEEDTEALNASGLSWATINDSNKKWVIIHNVSVPDGYNTKTVAVGIFIPSGYPDAALDMAYFFPQLSLESGKAIKAAAVLQQIDGKSWQRWSRHYTGDNPWEPSEHNVFTHLQMARTWLERAVV